MENQTYAPNEDVRALLDQNKDARLTSSLIIGLTTEITVLLLNHGIAERNSGRQEGINAAQEAMKMAQEDALKGKAPPAEVTDLESRPVADPEGAKDLTP